MELKHITKILVSICFIMLCFDNVYASTNDTANIQYIDDISYYNTKLTSDKHMVGYPTFSLEYKDFINHDYYINYNDNVEEFTIVNEYDEYIIFANYMNLSESFNPINSVKSITTVDVTYVCDSNFEPHYISGVDYSDNEYVVAKVESLYWQDGYTGAINDIDHDRYIYIITTKDDLGIKEVYSTTNMSHSIWLNGKASLYAYTLNDSFVNDDEIINVLKNFKCIY